MDRHCGNCRHQLTPEVDEPCVSCLEKGGYALWAAVDRAAAPAEGPDFEAGPAFKGYAARAGLPTDAAARKSIPIYSGFMKYFPDAIAAVAELSRIGNDQHNPGQPLHWDRAKSQDEMDALCRHMLDMASGTDTDTDGVLHATKQAWRAMAHLQKTIEAKRNDQREP